jgi:hypothetical protein
MKALIGYLLYAPLAWLMRLIFMPVGMVVGLVLHVLIAPCVGLVLSLFSERFRSNPNRVGILGNYIADILTGVWVATVQAGAGVLVLRVFGGWPWIVFLIGIAQLLAGYLKIGMNPGFRFNIMRFRKLGEFDKELSRQWTPLLVGVQLLAFGPLFWVGLRIWK